MAEAAQSSAQWCQVPTPAPIGSFIADFFCLDSRLAIELDGSQHGEDAGRKADQRRTELLEREGYTVLRFWNEEVLDNIDGVLETIARYL